MSLVNKIQVPAPVSLKHINLHHGGGKRTVSQRRIYRNGEWEIESAPELLKRAHEVAAEIEKFGNDHVTSVSSFTAKSKGDEIVDVHVSDLMNRFQILDFLIISHISPEILYTVSEETIRFKDLPDDIRRAATEEGFGFELFGDVWAPSFTPGQASFLQIHEDLSVRKGKGWEVSFGAAHGHFVENSYLSLELTRCAVRKHYHSAPVLVPTNVFIELGGAILKSGQRGYSTETS